MQDLGGYGVTAQSFEFLCTLDPNAARTSRPGWPRQWTPERDGKVWTFKLRQGVKWQDGTPTSRSADVVATMERLVKAGNSGLKGVLAAGWRGRDRPEHGHLHPGQPATATSRTSCRSSTRSR